MNVKGEVGQKGICSDVEVTILRTKNNKLRR